MPPHTFFFANVTDLDEDPLIYKWSDDTKIQCGSWQQGPPTSGNVQYADEATWYHGGGPGSLFFTTGLECDHTGGTNAGNHPGIFVASVAEAKYVPGTPFLTPLGSPTLFCPLAGPTSQTAPCYSVVIADKRCGVSANSAVAAAGKHVICGSNGKDKMVGTDGPDLILAGGGNDKVNSGKGNDIIEGGNGNDDIAGGKGRDQLKGGKGNDSCAGKTDREVSC